jgi:4-hydroxy-tetrahydrodipicolinate synthase
MKNGTHHHGVVVPMVTPVTGAGELDEVAVDRLVEFLIAGGIEGIFVLGTTGEGISVPAAIRRRLVQRTVEKVARRVKVYAGIPDAPADSATANEYFHAGADAIVAKPPESYPVAKLLAWYQGLLARIEGPLIMYNIPSTTNVSIPLGVVDELAGHPMVAGIKDSENDAKRMGELLRRFGDVPGFSIFVGVGALMADGLKQGADGIVPSVGNLIPDVCKELCASARRRDWIQVNAHATRMRDVAALYQHGRTLGQSLVALKAALHCRGLCTPHMLPPLVPLKAAEVEALRTEMSRLRLLD